MKHIQAILFALVASCCLITGCNTAQGFGQDMQEGGQAISKAAHDASSPNHGGNSHS